MDLGSILLYSRSRNTENKKENDVPLVRDLAN